MIAHGKRRQYFGSLCNECVAPFLGPHQKWHQSRLFNLVSTVNLPQSQNFVQWRIQRGLNVGAFMTFMNRAREGNACNPQSPLVCTQGQRVGSG